MHSAFFAWHQIFKKLFRANKRESMPNKIGLPRIKLLKKAYDITPFIRPRISFRLNDSHFLAADFGHDRKVHPRIILGEISFSSLSIALMLSRVTWWNANDCQFLKCTNMFRSKIFAMWVLVFSQKYGRLIWWTEQCSFLQPWADNIF